MKFSHNLIARTAILLVMATGPVPSAMASIAEDQEAIIPPSSDTDSDTGTNSAADGDAVGIYF